MTEKMTSFWDRHWGWIIQLLALIFSAGVIYATVNEAIKNRPDRTEMNNSIDQKIQKHVVDSKDQYIRSDQVPGLNENLQNIRLQLEEVKKTQGLILQNMTSRK